MLRHTLPALCLLACIARGQDPEKPLTVQGKFNFHVGQMASPLFPVEMAASAAILQELDTPREWGQGAGAYGKRFVSTTGASALRYVFAFGLDSTLHEDPRYRRSGRGNLFVRLGHAGRETFVTRTDDGGTHFSTWRFGSAFGAAYLSNQWYPDRLNTVASGFEQGAATIGLDLLQNIGREFWPDIKHKVFRR